VGEDADTIGLIVRGLEVLVEVRGDETVALPARAGVAALAGEGAWVEIGALDGSRLLAAPLVEGGVPPPGLVFVSARGLFDRVPDAALTMVGQALALVEFETMHRRCGRCGAATEPVPTERARRCPAGHGTFHPRIAPAVIVLVVRGDEMLLARNVQFPPGRFSAVAGFVEVGESLEETARREVREEVGVDVDQLDYFGSQPWPFGRSLMVGFIGRWAAGEIRVDRAEIAEAAWFAADRLPPALPPPVSIARRMIDGFLSRRPGAFEGGNHAPPPPRAANKP
jgi:NAD+ diphosphatase